MREPLQCRVVVKVRSAGSTRPSAATSPRGAFGQFLFDAVVPSGSEDVYTLCAEGATRAFLEGQSATVLLYGASGTGKTHLLEGPQAVPDFTQEPEASHGVVQRAVQHILQSLTPVPRHRYVLTVAFCGLSAGVDASVYDLLSNGTTVASMKDASAAATVDKLAQQQLRDTSDISAALLRGRIARSQLQAQGRPPMHTMLSIQLSGQTVTGERIRTGLSFVELAAPDPRDSLGRPVAQEPSLSRQLSLGFSSLTAVILALRSSTAPQRVPWRDSPLSRWLKDVLMSATLLTVVATVSPAPEAAPDTLATLSYVSKLRSGSRSEGVQITATWEACPLASSASPVLSSTKARGGTPSTGGYLGGSSVASHHHDPGAAGHRSLQVRAATPASANASGYVYSNSVAGAASQQHPQASPGAQEVTGPWAMHKALSPEHASRVGGEASSPGASSLSFRSPSPGFSGAGRSTAGGVVSSLGGAAARGSDGGRSIVQALAAAAPPMPSAGGARSSGGARPRAGSPTYERIPPQGRRTDSSGARPRPGSPPQAGGSLSNQSAVEELCRQLERLQGRLQESEREKETFAQELQRLGEMALNDTKELEWQARESSLERQLAVAQDAAAAKASALESVMEQLADAKRQADAAARDRDGLSRDKERLSAQVAELTERLQAQVRSLSEETGRLKSRASEAIARAESEEAARRAAESQLAALRMQVQSARGVEAAVQAQLASLQQQLSEANEVIETTRLERSKLQDIKWRLEDRVQSLERELDDVTAAKEQAAMEAAAELSAAQAQARSEASKAAAAVADAGTAKGQAEALKKQLAQLQSAFEEQKRLESGAARDIHDIEAMLRDFERDLEVHAAPVWRTMRAERSDAILVAPEGGSLGAAARWRPVVRTLLGAVRKHVNEAQQSAEAVERLQARLSAVEGQLGRTEELAAQLSAHQALRAEALTEIANCHTQLRNMEAEVAAARSAAERAVADAQAMSAELRAREEVLAAVRGERDELGAQAGLVPGLQRESRSRAQLLDLLWAEVRAMHLALSSLRASRASAPMPHAAHSISLGLGMGMGLGMGRASSPPKSRDSSPQPSMGGMRSARAPFGASAGGASTAMENLLGMGVGSPGVGSPGGNGNGNGSSIVALAESATGREQVAGAAVEARAQVSALVAEVSRLRVMAAEHQEAKAQLMDLEGECQELKMRLSSLQSSYANLEDAHSKQAAECGVLAAKITDLEAAHADQEGKAAALARQLEHAQEDLRESEAGREAARAALRNMEADTASAQQAAEARAREAERAVTEAQAARGELAASQNRLRLLEGQLADAQSQASTLSTRLSATERSLAEANSRATGLASKLAMAETDARLKVQEMASKAGATEDASRVAAAQAREALDAAERRARDAEAAVARLEAEAEVVRSQRADAVARADAAERRAQEARARVNDMEHVHSQLQSVMAERDDLEGAVRQLRHAQAQGAQELADTRRAMASLESELQRLAAERSTLAAQLEARKLDVVVATALSRNRGHLGASPGPGQATPTAPSTAGGAATPTGAASLGFNTLSPRQQQQQYSPVLGQSGFGTGTGSLLSTLGGGHTGLLSGLGTGSMAGGSPSPYGQYTNPSAGGTAGFGQYSARSTGTAPLAASPSPGSFVSEGLGGGAGTGLGGGYATGVPAGMTGAAASGHRSSYAGPTNAYARDSSAVGGGAGGVPTPGSVGGAGQSSLHMHAPFDGPLAGRGAGAPRTPSNSIAAGGAGASGGAGAGGFLSPLQGNNGGAGSRGSSLGTW